MTNLIRGVTQVINPELLELQELPSVSLGDRESLPECPSVYFAIDSDDRIQYIGRSVNPRKRWINHHCYSPLSDRGGVRIAYLSVDADLLPSVETALIRHFRPPLNKYIPCPLFKETSGECTGTVEVVLREVREAKGLTQVALAEKTGKSLQYLQRIEYGKAWPSRDTLTRLCKALECSPSELLKITEDK